MRDRGRVKRLTSAETRRKASAAASPTARTGFSRRTRSQRMKRIALLVVLLMIAATRPASAQERDVVLAGGWMFTSTGSTRVRNPGILIRAGKLLRVGGDLSIAS